MRAALHSITTKKIANAEQGTPSAEVLPHFIIFHSLFDGHYSSLNHHLSYTHLLPIHNQVTNISSLYPASGFNRIIHSPLMRSTENGCFTLFKLRK
ncbi:MAG: hypothetical protein KJ607_13730 [Bacteroidetes bacterium]|nr:hypothetical protein [Bacteroidota bacterium]